VGRLTEPEASADERQELAEAQAALRRIAVLVARGVSREEIFDAVVQETRRVLPADATALLAYAPDATAIPLVQAGGPGTRPPGRITLEGDSVTARVFATGEPATVQSYGMLAGPMANMQRERGLGSSVGAPVIVEGRLWGVLIAAWREEHHPTLKEKRARLAEFSELVATAIANAENRAELAASRARLVLAADDARRRIQRDLHDGAQQRLVSMALEIRAVQHALSERLVMDASEVDTILERILAGLEAAGRELLDIARGLHPVLLDRGGLEPALQALARQSPLRLTLRLDLPHRLPGPVEVASYYIVSEALTNASKHARATHVDIEVQARDGELTLTVRDDGVGGADPAGGTGLIGLRDRVEALGGRLEITSPRGVGTTLTMRLHVAGAVPRSGERHRSSAGR